LNMAAGRAVALADDFYPVIIEMFGRQSLSL
jgi:hypothetical protein